jgi:MFS transporter, UMF1 family
MSDPTAASPAPAVPQSAFEPARGREIFGWCCFDFANSAFTTVIVTVVYSVYFQSVVAGGDPRAEGWWGTTLGLSQLVVLLLAPLIGAIGDVTARKKTHLMRTAAVCALGTAALFFVGPGEVWLALALVFIANVAFSLGENICGAFLPELSTPETAGRISGYGWSFGYIGGLLSLVLAFLILNSGEDRAHWTFLMTGIFFAVACLPTLFLLRERALPRPKPAGVTYTALALSQIAQLRRDLPEHRTLARFFIAMTVYLSGLTAVVAFAALYAVNVIGMTQTEVIILFIVLQLAGVAGAFAFGFLQDCVGSKAALLGSLWIWIAVCAWASFATTKGEFYCIGVLAGIGMGGLQSAGRAVVSTLTPEGRQGEFFGYWGLFSKVAAVIGPLAFGWIVTHADGGYRTAILANCVFFAAGLALLLPLTLRRVAPAPQASGV